MLILFQSYEDQREQFKELLKDKEEEIQTLIADREEGKPQDDSEELIEMLNNQVLINNTNYTFHFQV
jgi:succinate dehydrogenase flavin-adding protein (antitoxin of CptAB toxin-antitoxin module)